VDYRDKLLSEPHIAPLMDLVYSLRAGGFPTPNVDPNDGGVNARALFLLESPGLRAVGTGYISQDNPDDSAANMRQALRAAGFNRSDVVLWNVVPYSVSTSHQNRNASARQITLALPETQAFLDRLSVVKAVVFCGRKAWLAKPGLQLPANTSAFLTSHPGAQAYNHERHRVDIDQTFKAAYDLISN
jgi:uracil-DNA glycosylase